MLLSTSSKCAAEPARRLGLRIALPSLRHRLLLLLLLPLLLLELLPNGKGNRTWAAGSSSLWECPSCSSFHLAP